MEQEEWEKTLFDDGIEKAEGDKQENGWEEEQFDEEQEEVEKVSKFSFLKELFIYPMYMSTL